MARDGYVDMTLAQANQLALDAIRDLDERNGDPSRRGCWIRERKLAWLVYALIGRVTDATQSFEIRR